MTNLYKTLDEGGIGIFESPTGTGKSLSIICSALQWIVDNEDKLNPEIKPKIPPTSASAPASFSSSSSSSSTAPSSTTSSSTASSSLTSFSLSSSLPSSSSSSSSSSSTLMLINSSISSPPTSGDTKESATTSAQSDWAQEFLSRQKLAREKQEIADMQEKKHKIQKRIDLLRQNKHTYDRPVKKRKIEKPAEEDSDATYLLDDYDSDDDGIPKKDLSFYDSDEDELEGEDLNLRKIYYCSRTHTQLTQFANEVKKTAFYTDISLSNRARVVCLASRKNLCINDSVLKLLSVSRINDKCLDMQKPGSSKCPYNDSSNIHNFSDHTLMKVRDIEELTALGSRLDACPYYGARRSIGAAQMVLLPYQTLLHKLTRESLGISLKNNIVILDEAHNLVEAINDMYAVEISTAQISQVLSQLQQYLEKYIKRLKPSNIKYVKQLIFVNQSFLKAFKDFKPTLDKQGLSSSVHTINDFLFDTKIDNINLFKLEKYFKRSEIVKKLNGFFEKHTTVLQPNEPPQDEEESSRHRPALGQIEAFLLALTNADKDGRVLITHHANEKKSTYKYLQLNAEVHFNDVVKDARSVILAGGTLQPVDVLKQNLFASDYTERISLHSYGHIIPPNHLLVLPLSAGPCSVQFEFTHGSRSNPKMMDELGSTLLNFCQIIPDGIVCFFPSYAYAEQVLKHWTDSALLSKIALKKKVFQEPRNSVQVEEMLTNYKRAIDVSFPDPTNPAKPKGAIMFCVVGGKMSEGINFSDGLARCVVIVGLPYPNPSDPFLKEKMEFIKNSSTSTASSITSSDYYDNLCMQAVNQSIGRSIRHAKDYASIVLIDHRYHRPHINRKLPSWISARIPAGLPQDSTAFGPAFNHIRKFFADKKDSQLAFEKARNKL
eukprot:Phypoly_transcript_02341.p1 GENE.Phypoly_transcript_02341~~Phypoly_transcript_02341.p1  ORF type:complete len:947 (+),score=142.85 Phypoly_transcript_02341:183-2843(+)